MNVAARLDQVEKDLAEMLDGVQGDAITISGKLDDLSFEIGEVRDLLTRVLDLLQPEDEGDGSQ